MVVIIMQVSPKGFSLYFTIFVIEQTNNESNNFGGFVVKSCTMESRKVVNTVLFNHSTDVFLCDTTCNFNTTMKYLTPRRGKQ